MNRVIISDAAHAWLCQLLYGPIAYWKIVTVRDETGSFMFAEKNELLKDVKSNGAVSPTTRAIDRSIPVRIPAAAAL